MPLSDLMRLIIFIVFSFITNTDVVAKEEACSGFETDGFDV